MLIFVNPVVNLLNKPNQNFEMKNNYKLICVLLLIVFLDSSCEKLFNKDDSSTLTGDTNVDFAQTGTTFVSSVKVGENWSNADLDAEIIENTDGVATIKVTGNLANTADLAPLKNLIPSEFFDGNGNLNIEGRFKATDKGMLDYTNADGEPFVMVKYDAKVGDKYILEKADGTEITRTVTAKSTDDDFAWGFMLIKTITVEQDSRVPGIQKFVYRFNHKFGLVNVEAVADDGSKTSMTIF